MNNIMNIENFIDTIVKALERRYPQCEVFTRQALKNNGIRLNGVIIKLHEESVAPTIYVDGYYDAYCTGKATLTSCVDDICCYYEEARCADVMSVDVNDFTVYESIRSRLRAKLVNTEKNADRLKGIPWVPFLDLSVIFEIIVQEKDGAKASSVVTNELLNCWGISVDELYRDALDNTEAYCGVGCWSLVDMICEAASAVGAPKEELDAIFAQRDECPMWVVSTKNQFDGAIALIYARKSVLSETVGSPNFYVLPSSRHEFILSPDNEQSDIKRLRDRVMSTNRTSVVAEDYLSDSVYRYDAESDTFVIV